MGISWKTTTNKGTKQNPKQQNEGMEENGKTSQKHGDQQQHITKQKK